MRRRLITNLVLLVVVAVSAALVYFEPWAEPPQKQPRLTDLDVDKVSRVTVSRSGQDAEQVVLVRKDSGWTLTKPFAMPAEVREVESLLEALRQRAKDHFPVGDRDLATFGLKEPSLKLEVAGNTIALGDKVPTERAMYAQVGETIYTVEAGLMRKADRRPTAYVERNLVPKQAKIVRIESDKFDVVRQGNDGSQWRVQEKQGPAAESAGKTLARAWETAVASDVEKKQYTGELQVDARVHTAQRDKPYAFARVNQTEDGKVAVTRPGLPVRYLVSAGMAERLFNLEQPQKPKDAEAQADQGKSSESSSSDKS